MSIDEQLKKKDHLLLISAVLLFNTNLHNASSVNVRRVNENGRIKVLNPETVEFSTLTNIELEIHFPTRHHG